MFKRPYEKRSTNIFIVIFRMCLSLFMFGVLAVGLYLAYRNFSSFDPLKIDFQDLVTELTGGKVPEDILKMLPSNKATEGLANQINQKVLGKDSSEVQLASSAKPTINLSSNLSFRFLLLSDSHNNNSGLGKAIAQAIQAYPDIKFIIGLGDYTDVGTVEELTETKKVLDGAGVRYFLIPGDHDLWDCRNRKIEAVNCFKQVFGPNYQSFSFNGFDFLLLDNSDNYIGFDAQQQKWMDEKLEQIKQGSPKGLFVLLHEPLYHPSSSHVMGWVEKGLKSQAELLTLRLKDAGVKQVFSGDIHFFSQYSEPRTGILMATVGAVSLDRNPQVPRFAVVSVYEDGSLKIEDMEIK